MQNMTYARVLLSLLQVAEGHGLNSRYLLDQAGVSRDWLKLPFNKIPAIYLITLFRIIHEQTGDDDIGVSAGRVLAAGNIYTRIHLRKISRTVRDFLKHVPSTDKLFGDVGKTHTVREGDLVRSEWKAVPGIDSSDRFLADLTMTFYARHLDSIAAKPIPLTASHFRYARPKDITTLHHVFGTNLLFEQPSSCFFFDAVTLDYPVIKLNDELLAEQPLESMFDQQEQVDPFLQGIFDTVARLLPSEDLSMEMIAAELGLSKRTLQRRLEEKDTKFKDVLLTVRERQAKRYLLDSNLSMTEIAFLLGYNNSANFSTAFKGWINMTPSEFREMHSHTGK